jgi:hypothetical protein
MKVNFLSDSISQNGEWLGLEHVHLIARLYSLNILVYNTITREYVELFYNNVQPNQIDHVISFNGRDHWSKHEIVIKQS